MTPKKWFFIGFAAIILLIPIYIVWSSENILADGTLYKFRLQARDPFDPFRGNYLRINYDTNNIPTEDTFERGDEAYVTLGTDSLGFAYFKEVFKSRPSSGDFMETTILSFYEDFSGNAFVVNPDEAQRNAAARNSVSIKVPNNMSKYFINEDFALKGETALAEYREDLYVGVRVLDGESRLQDIYVKGQPLMKFLEKMKD